MPFLPTLNAAEQKVSNLILVLCANKHIQLLPQIAAQAGDVTMRWRAE